MMVAVKHINLQMYEVEVSSLTEDYCTQVEFAKVDKKGSLLTVDNPNYQKIVKKYNHHKGVEMLDTETMLRQHGAMRTCQPSNLLLSSKRKLSD